MSGCKSGRECVGGDKVELKRKMELKNFSI